jgi:DNA repair protein RadA/Sms
LSGHDVYLNVAGGLKVNEPAADLAAAAALVSAFQGRPLDRDAVFFGEIGLSGDIRTAPQTELRLKEAKKLGFKSAILQGGGRLSDTGLALMEVKTVADVLSILAAPARPQRGPRPAVLE